MMLALVALAIGLAVFDAYATAPAQQPGPFDPALLATYAWVIGISFVGGLTSFHGKVRSGQARWVNLTELVGELFTSALAGLICFWICKAAGIADFWSAAFIGISGHMGSRALFMAEKFAEAVARRYLGASQVQTPMPEPKRGTPGDER